MASSGLAAFESRAGISSPPPAHESPSLAPEYQRAFEARKRAWAYFDQQPPGYRRTCLRWVMSAKGEETRRRRFRTLLESSAQRKRIPILA
jgi:uncharacterized protein YdeI (YjbR/CyaY-like superfamily)